VCVCSYVIWYERGYQEFDKVVSATTTKVKGIAVTNYTELNITVPGGYNGVRIWDVADYVVPPQVCQLHSPVVVVVVASGSDCADVTWCGRLFQTREFV